jgi:hypothetical protein
MSTRFRSFATILRLISNKQSISKHFSSTNRAFVVEQVGRELRDNNNSFFRKETDRQEIETISVFCNYSESHFKSAAVKFVNQRVAILHTDILFGEYGSVMLALGPFQPCLCYSGELKDHVHELKSGLTVKIPLICLNDYLVEDLWRP